MPIQSYSYFTHSLRLHRTLGLHSTVEVIRNINRRLHAIRVKEVAFSYPDSARRIAGYRIICPLQPRIETAINLRLCRPGVPAADILALLRGTNHGFRRS